MTRLLVCATFLLFFPNLAVGQSSKALCGFDDSARLVTCEQESRSVFRYEVEYPDVGVLLKLSSSLNGSLTARGDRERCRTVVEGFRADQVERKFNSSLEGLRLQAEKVRSASEGNLVLYKQIILIYDALVGRYKTCVQAYQDAVKSCHVVTPYDVRPDRI
ncbi:hypothetical protein [Bradyrhizobium sp. 192]|uniref:hypothetical protein n=1 Tax=Bradyrhizobium sp. 192 TaxID=2782660 RepID=UPI001FFF1815|nr:hypothetical protein [Bradyrhizobium sp. 192]UPJ55112.1 hypothetical protein IVB24_20705 [Bradyrhizobium sp. 192]